MVDDDVKRLLEIRIRRISVYDIERNRRQIGEVEARLAVVTRKLRNLKKTTIDYVKGLIEKYGDDYPRRTEIATIEVVDRKAVARQSIKLVYDKESGFFGSDVKNGEVLLTVSEFDFVLLISSDGRYRVMQAPEKQLIEGKVLHCKIFDPEIGEDFVVVYRDAQRHCFAKRIAIEKFIRNKEYRFFKDDSGRLDLLLRPDEAGTLELGFVPMKRQRVKSGKFALGDLEPTAVAARGTRVAPKPVARIKHVPAKARPAARKRKKKPRSASKPGKAKPTKSLDDATQRDLF
jgi:topoisomerase-4 subunit A